MKKFVSLLLAVCMVLSLALIVTPTNTALADSSEEENSVTEYVLLLDSTNSNSATDESNQRIAAAQLFIDLIPADNASLSIFAIGPKNGTFEGKSHYELRADKDRIRRDGLNGATSSRMQTIYQLVEGQTDLGMKDRTKLKELVADTFANASQYAGYSDEHCMIYGAMDYLLDKQAKNACIVFFGSQKAADYKNFIVAGNAGKNQEESLYAAISNYDSNYSNPNNSYLKLIENDDSEIPYKWSFNWVDISEGNTKNKVTEDFYTKLCEEFSGLSFAVGGDNYSGIPQAIVSIMNNYLDKASKDEKPTTIETEYTLELEAMFSEVNIAFTGTGGLQSIKIEYEGDGQPVKLQKTDTSSINNGKTTIWFNKQTDITSGQFTYAALKMVLPEPGSYHFTFEQAGKIEMQTIRAKDADIELTLGGVAEGVKETKYDDKSEDCQFKIAFKYNDREITNDKYLNNNKGATCLHFVCRDNAAYSRDVRIDEVYANVEKFDGGYTVKFPSDAFNPKEFHSGTYDVYATVAECDNFSVPRSSEHYTVTFKNNPPKLTGKSNETIEARPGETVSLGEQIEAYTDDDGIVNDTIQLTDLQLDKSLSDFSGDAPVDNGDGTITLPKHEGIFVYSATAIDNEGEAADKKVTVTINVVNDTPKAIEQKTGDKKRELYTGLSDIFLTLGLFDKEQKNIKINLCVEDKLDSDPLFSDGDGDEMTFYLTAENFEDALGETNLIKVYACTGNDENAEKEEIELQKDKTVKIIGDHLIIEPNMKGDDKVKLTLHAEDITGNGVLDAEDSTYVFEIKVKSVWAELFSRYWPILLVIGIILAIFVILLITRRVRGKWSVEIINNQNGQSVYQDVRSFAAASSRLRKYKVPVKDVVNFILRKNEIDDDEISAAEMSARNPILYGTILPGSCKMEVRPGRTLKVSVAGKDITKARKIKIKPRQDIVLIYLDEYDNEALTVNLSFN